MSAAVSPPLKRHRLSVPLDAGGAEVLAECNDGGCKLPAALAPGEVRSDARHISRRSLAVEHDRQRLANPQAAPAQGPGQLSPRAGVRCVALLPHRTRRSRDHML